MSTLIHELHACTNSNRFYVKREDLLPFSFGGNKARKAELFLKDIKEKRCDYVVTYGSGSSNHCRIIANMAAANGLKCCIISPEENYEETINSKLVEFFGAEIIKTSLDCVASTIDKTVQKLKDAGYNPYFIQGGGHGILGTQAYVDAYNEIRDYEVANNIEFDYIFHASGTGTTQAGLIAGKIMRGGNEKIIGISIARANPRGGQVIADCLNEYFGNADDYSPMVEFVDEYICGGYGAYSDEVIKTIKEVLLFDGIPLNTTYTGKAFCGMLNYIEKNSISDKKILFINTGGGPLFFDKAEELIQR